MQKIRHSTKKHRKLLTVVVAILTIGLVGSFAVWGSDGFSGDNVAESSTVDQIEYLEGIIAEKQPAIDADIDYDTANTMANLYIQLWAQYMQAAAESQSEDAAASLVYSDLAVDAAANAAVYYQLQLETAPDTLNDQAKAQILGRQATAVSYTGENEVAQDLFDQALALDPDNLEVAINYLNFVYITQGFEAAQAYGESYLVLVGESSETYLQMEQALEQMSMLEELYDSLETETGEEETAN